MSCQNVELGLGCLSFVRLFSEWAGFGERLEQGFLDLARESWRFQHITDRHTRTFLRVKAQLWILLFFLVLCPILYFFCSVLLSWCFPLSCLYFFLCRLYTTAKSLSNIKIAMLLHSIFQLNDSNENKLKPACKIPYMINTSHITVKKNQIISKNTNTFKTKQFVID